MATIILLKSTTKFKYKNTTPGEQKKMGKRLFTEFNNRLTWYYVDIHLDLYNIKARGQCYVKAIEVELLQKYNQSHSNI